MSTILTVNNLNYQDFHDFNLKINKGNFYTITGSRGKSTLFKLMCGIIPTNEVLICNNEVLSKDNVNNYIKNIGVVQTLSNNSFLFDNVKDELEYSLNNLGYSLLKKKRRINKFLSDFGMKKLYLKSISDLCLNDKQKLLFVIAMLHKPKVLLIDEAFVNLTKNDRVFIINYLKMQCKLHQLTVINFTVNLNDSLKSDHLYLLENGSIKLEGIPNIILQQDQEFYKCGLEVPFIIDLSLKLKLYGVVDKVYFDMEKLVNHIWK